MSYDVTDIIKVIVVIVGIILVISGFVDLANMSLSEQVIGSIFGLLGTGLIKIIVGGIFVLAVVYPDAIEDFVKALTGRP
jgi:hypothetical protein